MGGVVGFSGSFGGSRRKLGRGIGAFFIAPWVTINNAYAMRPMQLALIDGGYAIGGWGVIGAVLCAL